MLYTKHFYGFEKEGKSETYLEKQTTASVFSFKYPVKLSEIQDKLQTNVAKGLTDVEFLLPKPLNDARDEEKEAAAEAEKLEQMSTIKRRRYELEKKRQARMEVDLEPERLMKAGME